MPELPEVETVVRGMARVLEASHLQDVIVHRRDLRWPIPDDFEARLRGALVTRLSRRAKYALLHTSTRDVVILHLGMSGRIRIDPDQSEKHDHVVLVNTAGHRLVFNDPRRFGSLHLTTEDALISHPLLAELGPEPLGNEFNEAYLASRLAHRKSPLKATLLDQKIIAGLGNIYVCEALYMARLQPERPSNSLTKAETGQLTQAIRAVLLAAIAAGGSSLRDYVQVDGSLGYFQHQWSVYGRAGLPCHVCGSMIERSIQSGRSSFFCGTCQK